MKTHRILAFLLTLAMVLPMALPVLPVSAAEENTVEEISTETVPGDSAEETAEPKFYQGTFTDDTQLADFDLYQSGTSKFVVADGVLKADGTDGEQKAILKQDGPIKSLSVNILPGESGVIYGGVYFGAKNAQAGQDQIQSQVILIKSDYTGWTDAPNRIDIIHGQFNGGWESISTKISETGNGNNLFSGGTKEALNLKLVFSNDVMLLTLSLVSNPDKYVQYIYEIEPEAMAGQVGIRSLGSDTCYDKLIVNEDYIPESLQSGLKLDGTDEKSYAKTLTTLNEKPVTIEAWVKMEKPADKRRQAIISNYTGGSLASNAQGTWGLYTDEDGDLWYTERCGGTTYNQTERVEMWTDEWIHVAIVRGQGKLTVYANGELVIEREKDIMGEATVLDNYLTIGYCTVAAAGESTNSTQGEIGDIRLWRTERTQTQIQDNMYRELTGTEEGLMQHWNFDSQEKGIVSNTVEGGIDLELLGHTQIGNEEIRRWDFSTESQLEDFTFYYSTESTNVYEFQLKDGALYTPGSINNSSKDQKAILNEKIDNITYMGVDVTQGGTSTAGTGFVFGVKNINSPEEGDFEGFRARIGRFRTSSAKRPYGEIDFYKANGTFSKLTDLVANTTFFPGPDDKLPFHIQLEFDGNTANAYMFRLDDPTIDNRQSYTFADGDLDGQIGLWLGRTSVYYDNFTVISQIPVEEKPEQDTTTYDNEGYNFFNSGSKTWEMKQSIATPYTLEAWVKVPEGIADSTVGYIVGNPYRAPHISMQMANNGNLRLAWTVENADLTTSTTNYDVDTDLRNGRWTHVAYTCDVANDTVVAYINGKAVKTWTDAGLQDIVLPDHVSPANWFAVGSKKTNMGVSSNLFPGWIADVRLWDNALSADQIYDSMMTQYTTAKDGLVFNAPMTGIVDDRFEDLSGNGYHLEQSVSGFVLEEQTHEPGAYSMVVIPDQQILSHYYNAELQGMYQWIADNREKENIQIVMNVGDLADNCGNITQWERNKAAWELLPDDLPFIAVPGNHDYDTNSGWNKGYGVREQLTIMNQYFPMSIFENYPTDFGALSRDQGVDDNVGNTWQAFEVNGNRYLVLGLEYVPREDAVQWANDVIAAHPNHQVILITHSYVGSYGNLDRPYLWNDLLSKHENVIMAFSGHVFHTDVVHRTDKGENGNDVHNILMDAQGLDTSNRKYAMIGILRFNADGTLCDVSYFSTSRNQYEARSNFTLELPKQENKYDALVGLNSYESVTEAVANANGETVKILKDTDEAITISSDVTIDLAGYTLSNVTVAEGASLTLVDSTADYTDTKGSATVTGSVETLTEHDGSKYMVLEENGVYVPHKYYVGITHVSLEPAVVGFGYKAQFYGDEAVQAQVENIGYDLWLTEDVIVTRTTAFKNLLTLRLKNYMVDKYGETPVNAKVFMTLKNGTRIESSIHAYSMRSMVELINESYEGFTVQQLKAAAAMILKSETMQTWNVANILASLKPVATVESVAVENQEMTVYGGETTTLSLVGATKFSVQDTAEDLENNPYADWIADYYVSMDAEAGEGLYLAGNYGSYGWIALPVAAGQTYTDVPVVQTLLNTSVTYEEMVTLIGSFTCGVADTQNANTGATVTVELRLTDPEDPENYIVAANTSVYFDSALTTNYQVVTGGITTEGQVITSSEAGTVVLHNTRSLSDGTYFVEINTTDNTRPAGMIFAANDDATSYYLFRLGNGSKVELVKVEDGVETVVDTGYYPANRRKDVFSGLEIVVEGDTIHGYIHNPHYDRIHCFAVHTDDQMAGNRIGLWAANDGVVFQNSTLTADTAIRKADVVIFGHSYTEMWTDYKSYFPEYPSLDNVGLGGSVAVQWEQFPEEIASYEPELGIYLIGINDLTGGTTPKAVVTSMEKTLLEIKELVPEFEVVVTAVNHCPNRSTITAEISQCNALMRNLAASYDWIYYAETEYALCTDPSDPLSADSSLFSDGLHPNADGYAILVEAIRAAANGEDQPAFDEELAREQLAEVKAEKMTYLAVYGQNSYTVENWVLAEPYYNAAVEKINACTTEMQLKNLDLSQELAQLDAIRNKAADVIANIQDPENSIQRSALSWTGVDDYTVNLTGYTYSLDSTAVYKNPEGIFKFGNNSGAVGTAGVLLNAHVGENLGMYGYLINCNTNGNYIQIYYVSNSYNNDGTSSATKYIGGIVLNNYGIRVEDTEFWFKIDGDKMYVNTVDRKEQGEADMLVVDLTADGVYEVYESGYVGLLAWAGTTTYDIQLQRFAAEEVIVEEEEPVDDPATQIIANLMATATRDSYNVSAWQQLDDNTVNAGGYSFSLDNTAWYSDSEAVFMLSNATGNIGTAGLVLRANQHTNNGLDGYLVNVNTSSNFIQVFYLNNAYNTDSTAYSATYLGGIVCDNFGVTADETEWYVNIQGGTMYINTLARKQAGTGNIVTVDLTKGGTYEVYSQGHTGIVSWVNGVSFDLRLKTYTGTEVDVNQADEALANIMDSAAALTYGTATWTAVDENTLQMTGYRYSMDSTQVVTDATVRFTLDNNTGHIGTGGILLRASKADNNGLSGYLINYNINSNYIQIYYMSNYYNNDSTEKALTYLGGIVLNNYDISNVGTEFVATIEGDKLYVNTTEREQAGTGNIVAVDLTYGGTIDVYESGYFGLLSWVSDVTFDLQIESLILQ